MPSIDQLEFDWGLFYVNRRQKWKECQVIKEKNEQKQNVRVVLGLERKTENHVNAVTAKVW